MDINNKNRQTSSDIASTSASTGDSNNTSQNTNTGLNRFSYADFVLYDDRVIKKIEIANITNENDWVIIAVKEEKDLCEIRFYQNNIKEIKYYGDSCFFIMLGEDKKIYILD